VKEQSKTSFDHTLFLMDVSLQGENSQLRGFVTSGIEAAAW
jgi:hypothetical protein